MLPGSDPPGAPSQPDSPLVEQIPEQVTAQDEHVMQDEVPAFQRGLVEHMLKFEAQIMNLYKISQGTCQNVRGLDTPTSSRGDHSDFKARTLAAAGSTVSSQALEGEESSARLIYGSTRDARSMSNSQRGEPNQGSAAGTSLALAATIAGVRSKRKKAFFELDSMWKFEEPGLLSASAAHSGSVDFDVDRGDKGDLVEIQRCLVDQNSVFQFIMVNPSHPCRIVWVVFGLILITYDVLVLPLDLATLLHPSDLRENFNWFVLVFWALDLPLNFITGYDIDGVTEMRPYHVAVTYLKGWFICDLCVVSLDTVISLILYVGGGEKQSGVGFFRATRVFRMLRLLRLLRIRRLVQASMQLGDTVSSEGSVMIVKITRLVAVIMILNHYIACAWYLIAASVGDDGYTWLDGEVVAQLDNSDGGLWHVYAIAFHWSLTQFTPATQNVGPHNESERVFAICVVLIALVTFSSFIGRMTSAMSQLLNLNAKRYQEEMILRKFFRDHSITTTLVVQIWKCYRRQSTWQDRDLRMQDIEYFSVMPKSLLIQLRKELFSPYLKALPVFELTTQWSRLECPAICNHAMASHVGEPLKEIFVDMTEAREAYCVTKGVLAYDSKQLMDTIDVSKGEWIAEAALWGSWFHRGTLTSRGAAHWIAMDVSRFRSIMQEASHSTMARVMRRYALKFSSLVSELDIFDVRTDTYEVDMFNHIAKEAVEPEMERKKDPWRLRFATSSMSTSIGFSDVRPRNQFDDARHHVQQHSEQVSLDGHTNFEEIEVNVREGGVHRL